MAVRFDVLQFGDIFSIQVNGKETMGLTEEEIIFLHDKYRQAYKKPCVDDLEQELQKQHDYIGELEQEACKYEDEIEELKEDLSRADERMFSLEWDYQDIEEELELKQRDSDNLKEENWELREKIKALKEELEKDNRELVTKIYFLRDELNDWKKMCKELKGENYDR